MRDSKLLPISAIFRLRSFSDNYSNTMKEIDLLIYIFNLKDDVKEKIYINIADGLKQIGNLEILIRNARTRLNILKFIREEVREQTIQTI